MGGEGGIFFESLVFIRLDYWARILTRCFEELGGGVFMVGREGKESYISVYSF